MGESAVLYSRASSTEKLQVSCLLSPNSSDDPTVKLFLLDENHDPPSNLEQLRLLSLEERWTSVNTWLVRMNFQDPATTDNDEKLVAEAMRELKLSYTSEVFCYVKSTGIQVPKYYGKLLNYPILADKISLYEVYKISEDDLEVQVLPYGAWTVEDGLEVNSAHVWHRRADLKGKLLR